MSAGKNHICLFILFLGVLINPSSGQPDVLSMLENRFNQFVQAVPREEVFIHTDRDEYIAGEEMFFALYVLNRQNFRLSPYSKIAYVELLNEQQLPIFQQKILTLNGTGSSGFSLPDTLRSGAYTLKAYTNWMKNSLPANCFTKTILIYNFLREKNDGSGIVNRLKSREKQALTRKSITLFADKSLHDSILIQSEIIPDSVEGPFNVIIQTHGRIDFARTLPAANKKIRLIIPASALEPGINQITIFDHIGNPLGEKLINTPSPENTKWIIEGGTGFNIRDKIALTVHASDQTLQPGVLSLSVVPGSGQQTGIMDYLVLGTEFDLNAFEIQHNKKDIKQEELLDSLLTGKTSNWIDWKLIVTGKFPEFQYPIENEFHFINGTISLRDSAQWLLLNSPGKQAVFQYTVADHHGRFAIPIILDKRLNDYIVMPSDNNSSKITIESSFLPEPELTSGTATEMRVPDYISDWNINFQVRRLYNISETVEGIKTSMLPDKIRFYGKPDFELVMADFILLPTMEEVFYEILPHVSIRKIDKGKEIVITDRIDNRPYVTIPCLMIDGVIIKNPMMIIDLDPQLVEKIDVIRSKYIVGSFVFPGIVNVITKKGDFSSVAVPDYMTRIIFHSAASGKTFNLPDHSGDEKLRIPDYRTTLFWNPDIHSSSIPDFTANDLPGNYIIRVEGVTSDGIPVSGRKIVTVLQP